MAHGPRMSGRAHPGTERGGQNSSQCSMRPRRTDRHRMHQLMHSSQARGLRSAVEACMAAAPRRRRGGARREARRTRLRPGEPLASDRGSARPRAPHLGRELGARAQAEARLEVAQPAGGVLHQVLVAHALALRAHLPPRPRASAGAAAGGRPEARPAGARRPGGAAERTCCVSCGRGCGRCGRLVGRSAARLSQPPRPAAKAP